MGTVGTAIINEYRMNLITTEDFPAEARQRYLDRNEALVTAWNLLYPQFDFPAV